MRPPKTAPNKDKPGYPLMRKNFTRLKPNLSKLKITYTRRAKNKELNIDAKRPSKISSSLKEVRRILRHKR